MEPAPRPLVSTSASDPRLGLWVPNTVLALDLARGQSDLQLQLQISEDGGDTFGKAVPVSEPGASVRAGGENSPVLFTDVQGDIYAAWFQTSASGATQLMVGRSVSFGESFEKPKNVLDVVPKEYAGFPTIAATHGGESMSPGLMNEIRSLVDLTRFISRVPLIMALHSAAIWGLQVQHVPVVAHNFT